MIGRLGVDARQVIRTIREDVNAAKVGGSDFVSAKALESYLEDLETHVGEGGDPLELERVHERGLAHYKAVQQFDVEMSRSVISTAQSALKSSVLINGSAAAGTLAFIGGIWDGPGLVTAVGPLATALCHFALGVLASGSGTVTTYLTQFFYSRQPYSCQNSRIWYRFGFGFHVVSLILVVASFILFGLGSYCAYRAIAGHLG